MIFGGNCMVCHGNILLPIEWAFCSIIEPLTLFSLVHKSRPNPQTISDCNLTWINKRHDYILSVFLQLPLAWVYCYTSN